MSTPGLLIVGAGLAGWTVAREFRKLDAQRPVTLVTADSGDFYAKPSLSNAFAQGRSPSQLVTTPAGRMAEQLGLTLLPYSRVARLDTAAREVTLEAGTVLPYGQLVLATGAQPVRAALAGNAAQRVQSVNSLMDFEAFHAGLQSAGQAGAAKPRVLIMGGGLIGCEFANDLAAAGHAVTVVDPGAMPLASLLPVEAGLQLQQALEGLGVRFVGGQTVTRVQAADACGREVDVHLSGGEVLRVHRVLSAIGLKPHTALAQAAGLEVDRGILVNRQLRTSAEGVYALGDGAQYASAAHAQAPRGATLPFVLPLMNAARSLAQTLAGQETGVAFGLMPVAVKTPALPLVVAPPPPGTPGGWQAAEPGIWRWLDAQGRQHGFVLAGAQTAQRVAESRRVAA